MIRQGLLGEIVHCHCAHSHDCIDHWFFDARTGKDKWPAKYLLEHNRDQYPTHQLGPVLSWMDINCGDAFDTLTSTATGSFGINDMFEHKFGKGGLFLGPTHAIQVGSPLENILALYRTAGSLCENIDDSILSIKDDEDQVDKINMSKLY